jgi:hypothetical protein
MKDLQEALPVVEGKEGKAKEGDEKLNNLHRQKVAYRKGGAKATGTGFGLRC